MSPKHARAAIARRSRPAILSVAAVSAGALAFAPGSALAATPSVHGVASHVHMAAHEVGAVIADVRRGASANAISGAVHAIGAQTTDASNLLAGLYRNASTPSSAGAAAQGLELFAQQQGSEAQDLTGILGQVPAALQSLIAQLVSSSTIGNTVSVNLLGDLLPHLGGATQSTGAQTIVSQTGQSGGIAGELAQGLSGGSIACVAEGFISQALAAATATLDSGTSILAPLLSVLPSNVGADIESLISGLPAMLEKIVTDLTSSLTSCPSSSSTGMGGSGSTTSTGAGGSTPMLPGAGLISGVLQTVTGLLDDLLGGGQQSGGLLGGLLGGGSTTSSTGTGSTGSTTPTTGVSSVTSPLSGIFSLIEKLVPGLGSLTSLIPGAGTGSSTGGGFFGL